MAIYENRYLQAKKLLLRKFCTSAYFQKYGDFQDPAVSVYPLRRGLTNVAAAAVLSVPVLGTICTDHRTAFAPLQVSLLVRPAM